ncbi:MAG TPA: RNA polymerase sigma factor [Planctomycetes bacterium]|nr:RNA polymerase sigma factor [Planctomycetota bacterium]
MNNRRSNRWRRPLPLQEFVMAERGSGLNGSGDRTGSISTAMLAGLRRREPSAWNRFVQLFVPVLYHRCRKKGLQPSDAEDVVQEVLLRVAAKIDTFHRSKEGQTFRGWLWTITDRKIVDHFRSRGRSPPAVGGTDAGRQMQQLAADDPTTTEAAFQPDSDCLLARRLLELIRADFSEATWQAFWRMTVEGEKASEIAADLGKSAQAVRQDKYRVLRRFRQEWEAFQAGP